MFCIAYPASVKVRSLCSMQPLSAFSLEIFGICLELENHYLQNPNIFASDSTSLLQIMMSMISGLFPGHVGMQYYISKASRVGLVMAVGYYGYHSHLVTSERHTIAQSIESICITLWNIRKPEALNVSRVAQKSVSSVTDFVECIS